MQATKIFRVATIATAFAVFGVSGEAKAALPMWSLDLTQVTLVNYSAMTANGSFQLHGRAGLQTYVVEGSFAGTPEYQRILERCLDLAENLDPQGATLRLAIEATYDGRTRMTGATVRYCTLYQ